MRRRRVLALVALVVAAGAALIATVATSSGAITSDIIVLCWDEDGQPQNSTYVASVAQTFAECNAAGLERQRLLDLRNNGAGPPGPQGATGPAGPAGPAGPQGARGPAATTASAFGIVGRRGGFEQNTGALRAVRVARGEYELFVSGKDNCVAAITPVDSAMRVRASSENEVVARRPGAKISVVVLGQAGNSFVDQRFNFTLNCRAR